MAFLIPDDSLLHFGLRKKNFIYENGTTFIGDELRHLTLCLRLIQPQFAFLVQIHAGSTAWNQFFIFYFD